MDNPTTNNPTNGVRPCFSHFNERGHFLQGLVWTAKLFNVDVTKGAYVPKCLEKQPERAKLMRQIATDTVLGK